jgi:transcriptional regulator GlxA family with amidase domain
MIRQALLYLNEYYAQPLKVQDLANSLNVSYRHLARLFKQVTGVTIIGKLNDIRVNQAKNLLKDTDVTIRDIALRVGFENEFYFTNIFSHYTYTTPSAFRKKFR